MKLSSSEIPQADVLEDVFKVVDGISAGAHKFQEIASYIGKVERQGRYYRLAAQLLGLVENTNNYATLTELGVELAQANEETRIAIVRDSFVQTRLFQRLLPFLEREVRLTHATIVSFLNELSEPVGQSMMQRRSSTVLSWLMNFKIIKKKSDYYVFNRTSFLQNGAVKYSSLEEPLLPSSIELSEYQIVKERTGAISKEISFIQNNVAIERANNHHIRLANMISEQLTKGGNIPKYNSLIDLAVRIKDIPYIFEIKTIQRKNTRDQVRSGISQLYEYRYLQNLSNAKLVLVLQNQLPASVNWMADYLEKDRKINLIWDGDNKLFSNKRTRKELSFLWGK